MAFLVDEDILGFEITVHNAVNLENSDGLGDIPS